MTVELSCIHLDALDKEDLPALPSEFKFDIYFPGEAASMPISWKGYVISQELVHRVEHLARFPIYPRDFFWKSSNSERMHKWSYDMPITFKKFDIVRLNVNVPVSPHAS